MKFKICGRKHTENGTIELCTIIEIIINKTLCKTLNGPSVYLKLELGYDDISLYFERMTKRLFYLRLTAG